LWPKYGCDSLKITRNSSAIPAYFQLRLARILKELSQKHIRQQSRNTMRRVEFFPQHFYHVYNRGVDKRTIFQNERDYLRFYTSLFVFNDENYRGVLGLDVNAVLHQFCDQVTSIGDLVTKRKPLVNIVSFCLMPNHFHFLLEQIAEQGVPRFMHRIALGYAEYFNKKNDRTGRLFEGPFKAVLVQRDAQLEHLPRYIHLNALDLITDLNWGEGKIADWARAEKFLEEYSWSSHGMYLNKPQLLPVIKKAIVEQIFDTPEKYINFLKQWLGHCEIVA